ncbi:MAG: hypothetical protein GXY83_02855 [Rhodopirellula sp.]|nr:hypothetical protein [Rhodopirellula sp.]
MSFLQIGLSNRTHRRAGLEILMFLAAPLPPCPIDAAWKQDVTAAEQPPYQIDL